METITRSKLLSSLFKDAVSAEQAYNSLLAEGYTKDDITVVMSDDTRNKYFSNSDLGENSVGTKAVEGLGVGSAAGGVIGAIAGAIAAIGTTLVIPGLGLIIAGPIAAALAGAGAGSMTGGLVGTLVGAGFPNDKAAEYEKDIQNGGVLISFQPKDDQDESLSQQWNAFN